MLWGVDFFGKQPRGPLRHHHARTPPKTNDEQTTERHNLCKQGIIGQVQIRTTSMLGKRRQWTTSHTNQSTNAMLKPPNLLVSCGTYFGNKYHNSSTIWHHIGKTFSSQNTSGGHRKGCLHNLPYQFSTWHICHANKKCVFGAWCKKRVSWEDSPLLEEITAPAQDRKQSGTSQPLVTSPMSGWRIENIFRI